MTQPQHTPSEVHTVPRYRLDSSSLKTAGYADDRQIFAVEFSSGLIIHYDGVPLSTVEAFGAAESRGRFYAKEIKGKFKGRVMTGLCPKCAFAGLVGELCEHCKAATVRVIEKHRGD